MSLSVVSGQSLTTIRSLSKNITPVVSRLRLHQLGQRSTTTTSAGAIPSDMHISLCHAFASAVFFLSSISNLV
jgi:hypothetical protein